MYFTFLKKSSLWGFSNEHMCKFISISPVPEGIFKNFTVPNNIIQLRKEKVTNKTYNILLLPFCCISRPYKSEHKLVFYIYFIQIELNKARYPAAVSHLWIQMQNIFLFKNTPNHHCHSWLKKIIFNKKNPASIKAELFLDLRCLYYQNWGGEKRKF